MKGQIQRLTWKIGLVAVTALAVAMPAAAADPGEWNFQIYGGWYLAGDLQALEDLEGNIGETLEQLGLEPGDDLTFGIRAGRRTTEKWGWEATLGFFDVDDAVEGLEQRAGLDLGLFLFDLSAIYYVGGGSFFYYGGAGLANTEVDIDHNGTSILDESETNLSLNAGLGYLWDIGGKFFLRVDGKLRWIDAEYYDGNTDAEVTVGVGWDF